MLCPLPQFHLSLVFLEGTYERHMSHLRRGLVNVNLQINHLYLQTARIPSFFDPAIAALHFPFLEPGALDTLPLHALKPLLAPVHGTYLSSNSVRLAGGKA